MLRIHRPYTYAYAGMETPLDNLMGAIFFMHTDKRRHSFNPVVIVGLIP